MKAGIQLSNELYTSSLNYDRFQIIKRIQKINWRRSNNIKENSKNWPELSFREVNLTRMTVGSLRMIVGYDQMVKVQLLITMPY